MQIKKKTANGAPERLGWTRITSHKQVIAFSPLVVGKRFFVAMPWAERWAIWNIELGDTSSLDEDDFEEGVYFQRIPEHGPCDPYTLAERMKHELTVESIFDRADRQLDLILISIMYESVDFVAAQHHRFAALMPKR